MTLIRYDTEAIRAVSPRQRRHTVYMGVRIATEALSIASRVIGETDNQEEYTVHKRMLNGLLQDLCAANGTVWFEEAARFDWDSAIEESIERLASELKMLMREV